MRVNVYVDGFNLYYGAVKDTEYKWLNLDRVLVYVPFRSQAPSRGAAVELRGAADRHRGLPNLLIQKSQFPPKIPDGSGGFIHKPADW